MESVIKGAKVRVRGPREKSNELQQTGPQVGRGVRCFNSRILLFFIHFVSHGGEGSALEKMGVGDRLLLKVIRITLCY